MRVSIVIPCYNAAATLAAAIESALAQADANIEVEVIVVDDGSVDDSLAIARGFEPRIRVHAGPNRGVSHARNCASAEAHGEWIIFLDSDDLLLPGSLRERLATAEATNADVVICDWQDMYQIEKGLILGAAKSISAALFKDDPEIAAATHAWATTAAILYKRDIVEKIGGFRPELGVIQDARYLFDAAYHKAKFAHSPHLGARYRVLEASLSRRDPAHFWRDVLTNGKQIEALWRVAGNIDSKRRVALMEIYNGAAHGLFRAADPALRDALAALRAADLEISLKNHIAEVFMNLFGSRNAARAADLWTACQQLVRTLLLV